MFFNDGYAARRRHRVERDYWRTPERSLRDRDMAEPLYGPF